MSKEVTEKLPTIYLELDLAEASSLEDILITVVKFQTHSPESMPFFNGEPEAAEILRRLMLILGSDETLAYYKGPGAQMVRTGEMLELLERPEFEMHSMPKRAWADPDAVEYARDLLKGDCNEIG